MYDDIKQIIFNNDMNDIPHKFFRIMCFLPFTSLCLVISFDIIALLLISPLTNKYYWESLDLWDYIILIVWYFIGFMCARVIFKICRKSWILARLTDRSLGEYFNDIKDKDQILGVISIDDWSINLTLDKNQHQPTDSKSAESL